MNIIENEEFYKILHSKGLYYFKKIYSVNGNKFQKGVVRIYLMEKNTNTFNLRMKNKNFYII